MTHNKRLTDKLMDIARWYAMPADHFNVVKEAVKILQDAPSAGDSGSYNSVKSGLDLISRQAAIDALRTCYDTIAVTYEDGSEYISYDQALSLIDELQSVSVAEKTGRWTRWIPVSERLPKIHQDVLLSLRSLDVVVGFRAGTEPYFYSQGDYIEPQNVLAWMPLLQPYKGESEE